jgi:hypothetical protein
VGKELTSVKVTDEGEDFLNVEAVSSDDSIDGVLFKLTHPNGSSEEILVVCLLALSIGVFPCLVSSVV